ncbi:MAG TPA: aldolase, partial [Gemmatimonadaceae bacterium]|nr:aldolase [Gemmatimonadaceae bacterium]
MSSAFSVFGSAVTVHDGRATVNRDSALASAAMDTLVRLAVFGETEEKDSARWLIWELGQAVGVRAASIQELYMARGRGEVRGFTVPAINVR